MAILLHLSSTDNTPTHAHRPPGKTSWFFWQRATSKFRQPSSHTEQETLPPDIGKKLVPIFLRLSVEKLLKRCATKMLADFHQGENIDMPGAVIAMESTLSSLKVERKNSGLHAIGPTKPSDNEVSDESAAAMNFVKSLGPRLPLAASSKGNTS